MTNKFEAEITRTQAIFGMTHDDAVEFIIESAKSEISALQAKIDFCHSDMDSIQKRDEIQNRTNGIRIADMVHYG